MSSGRCNKARVLETDKEVLADASRIQQDTLAALRRIQSTANEAEVVGSTTVAALSDQSDKLKGIHTGQDRVEAGLRHAEKLQNKLGRWSLRFTKRAAKREVKEEIEEEKSLGTSSTSSSKISRKTPVVVTPPPTPPVVEKKKKQSRLLRKDTSGPSWQSKPTRSKLLDKTPTGPHKEKLEELQDVDDEIEDALDAVGDSLDRLMDINTTMADQVNHQTQSIDHVSTRMADADRKQRIINKRATKFLDGKVRKQNERVDAFAGVSRASKAAGIAARTVM